MASNASSVAALLRRLQRPRDTWRLQLSFLEMDGSQMMPLLEVVVVAAVPQRIRII